MNAPAPVAVGYTVATTPDAAFRQCEAIEEYARTEGIALAQIVTDDHDTITISQVAETARLHEAQLVLIPAGVVLAEVREGITDALAPLGAACVVVGHARETEA
ncbi:hypothetical protein L1785_09820 [Antribacter sp. KLBMP9083]|uniref:Uncharacterized protein n=1 Tax=Antribacter soli TaxID=2910976 RepID=A0AA41QD63_9MICO|nr:hypothetical protein [Antribacter soli]MCF4121279.1 hypothetical protein [Antribacter soli]